jgi:uncharacterized membrane protein SpoIIM required for sporulation
VRVYLNGIAQQIFRLIYKNNTGGSRRFWAFWQNDLPAVMYACRPQLLLSTLLFVLGVTIGWVSGVYHPEFARIILGDGYVQMTESFIESGDPMAVYKQMDPWPMFLMIAWNNAKVSFIMFALGIFFSAGTILAMLRNSIMVGAFVFFFYEKGLFRESFLTIMMHGTIELSVLILAGTAGIVAGRGLVFPGTYSRMTAFVISGRQGIKIMMGLLPFEIFAAFIEGYVTRYTETPDFIRGLLILLSLLVMVGFFVYYPWARVRSGAISPDQLPDVPGSNQEPIRFDEAKSAVRMFNELFRFFAHGAGKLVYRALALAAGYMLLLWLVLQGDLRNNIESGFFDFSGDEFEFMLSFLWFPDDVAGYLNFEGKPVLFLALVLMVAVVFDSSVRHFARLKNRWQGANTEVGFKWKPFFVSVLAAGLLVSAFAQGAMALLLLPALGPILLLALPIAYTRDKHFFSAVATAWQMTAGGKWRLVMMLFFVFSVQCLFMLLVNAPLQWVAFDIVTTMLRSDSGILPQIPYLMHGISCVAAVLVAVPLSIYAAGLYLFSQEEVITARHLKARIDAVKPRKKAYGLEKEQ